MKKLFTIAVLLVISVSSFAQSKAHLGIRVGASSSYYSGRDFDLISDSTERKWSPTAGFYINSLVSDFFWIKTEFNFLSRGLIQKTMGKELHNNFYYVDMYPICPALHVYGAQLFVGPALSVLVTGSNQKIDAAGVVRTYSDNDLDGYNRLDVGAVAGFEYEAPFGLNVGARYVKGFSSLREPLSGQPRFEMFNDVFLVTLGYTIGRKKED